MNLLLPRLRAVLLALPLAGLLAGPGLPTAHADDAPFELQGRRLDGTPFSLAQLKGRVVLLLYWRTDCAPCRAGMAELRANGRGWRHQPFTVVSVGMDARREDALAWHQALQTVMPDQAGMPALWAGEPGYRDSLPAAPRRWPLVLVLDRQGRVAARHEGQLPPEAWDEIAGLLP